MSYKRKLAKFVMTKYNKLKEERDKKKGKNIDIKQIQRGNKIILRYEGSDHLSVQLNVLREIIEEFELQ